MENPKSYFLEVKVLHHMQLLELNLYPNVNLM